MKNRSEEFRQHAYQFVDWMADYMDQVEDYPVKSQVKPKEIYNQVEDQMPNQGESIDTIFNDFKDVILPGITHWQSPNFFAYFPANSSPPSVLAEMLTATLGIQGMKWETSPASTELEEKMMEWLMKGIGIPESWSGVIQDTASSATLASIITAREQETKYNINNSGFNDGRRYRIYCSEETHSSIEKGAKIAGIGKENVVKIGTDDELGLRPDLLEASIQSDLNNNYVPLCIIATLGTTGTTAMDPIERMGEIATKHNIWFHIDAAYAGNALLLPEFKHLVKGIDQADSFVFNPHKWLFTNFDCSVYFVKDKGALIRTFEILPEYLKTQSDGVVHNHCDWGVPLGRRFRSLKLWFVLRYYGLEGLQNKLRQHIELAGWLESKIKESEDFEMVVPRKLNLVCFHYHPKTMNDNKQINTLNETILHEINSSGKIYLTHTKVNQLYTIRMVIGQTHVTKEHVEKAWKVINDTAIEVSKNHYI